MKLHQRFHKLTLWNKIGVIGAIASIIGVILFFFSPTNNEGISIKGDISNSTILQVFGNVNLNKVEMQIHDKDILSILPKWMAGKVLVPYKDQFAFQGSGFIVIFNKRTFFITSNSLITSVNKIFGNNTEIFVQLPYVRGNAFRTKYLFTIENENSVVYAIDDLIQEGQFETKYLSPYQLSINQDITILGYSSKIYKEQDPAVIAGKFFGRASYNRQSDIMHIAPNIKDDDEIIFISTGGTSKMGMGGGPVFLDHSTTLIGMHSAIGDDKKDPRVFSTLGVKEFNIFHSLEQTIERLKAIGYQK